MIDVETSLHEYLQKYFGFKKFKGQQEAIIASLLEGKDTFVIMPTGGGKSLTFQLPALLEGGLTVVVSPLIALMKDQVEELQASGAPVAAIYSGIASAEQRSILDQVERNEINLLYASPERIAKSDQFEQALRRLAAKGAIKRLVFDEAHCLSQWGHDFRPEYKKVKNKFSEMGLGNIPIACLTATATEQVKTDLKENLELQSAEEISYSSDRPSLEYHAVKITGHNGEEKKLQETLKVLEWVHNNHPNDSVIVYAATRKSTESIAKALQRLTGRTAEAYNAGLSAHNRNEVQERFKNGETKVIVATNAFGMGVDKKNVRFVIHFHPPSNLPAYIQEAGRAGRDRQPAYALMLHSSRDWSLHEFMSQLGLPEQHHAQTLVELLKQNNGMLRLYEESIAEQINEALEENQSLIDKKEVNWLLNTMNQCGLLEYEHCVGKARLIFNSWKTLEILGTENLGLLERLDVKLDSKLRQHWLDFSCLQNDEARMLCDALHNLRRILDTPHFQFSTFESCLEIKVLELDDFSDFKKVLDKRLEQRRKALIEMERYAESKICRREGLLKVFNDQPRKDRNRDTCCDACNAGFVDRAPWQLIQGFSEDEIASHYRPNRGVLEFLRSHRKDALAWNERKQKADPNIKREYNGLGKMKITLTLQGKESSPPIQGQPIKIGWLEQNSNYFGSMIGVNEKAIEKALTVLANKGFLDRIAFEQGATYRINERGLQELEKPSRKERA